MVKQANELASMLCDIDSDRLGAKGDRKKRYLETEDQRKNKSEQKQIMDDDRRLKGLET